jgi:hypothetical protein
VFFFASAAASSAYLVVSESFSGGVRALSIAFFYALGTAIGGIGAPWLFGSAHRDGRARRDRVGICVGGNSDAQRGCRRHVARSRSRAEAARGSCAPAIERGFRRLGTAPRSTQVSQPCRDISLELRPCPLPGVYISDRRRSSGAGRGSARRSGASSCASDHVGRTVRRPEVVTSAADETPSDAGCGEARAPNRGWSSAKLLPLASPRFQSQPLCTSVASTS